MHCECIVKILLRHCEDTGKPLSRLVERLVIVYPSQSTRGHGIAKAQARSAKFLPRRENVRVAAFGGSSVVSLFEDLQVLLEEMGDRCRV